MERSLKTEPDSCEAKEWVVPKSDGLLPPIKIECLEQESPSSKPHSGTELIKCESPPTIGDCESPPDPMKTVFIKMEPLEEEDAIGSGADPLDPAKSEGAGSRRRDLGNPALKDHGAGERFCLAGHGESRADSELCSGRPQHTADELCGTFSYQRDAFGHLNNRETTPTVPEPHDSPALAENSTETRPATLSRPGERGQRLRKVRLYLCLVCSATFNRVDLHRRHLETHPECRPEPHDTSASALVENSAPTDNTSFRPDEPHKSETGVDTLGRPRGPNGRLGTGSEQRRYLCPVCSLGFSRIGLHRQHLETHPEYRPEPRYKSASASVGNSAPTDNFSLRPNKPLKCETDSATFGRPREPERRLEIGSQPRLYRCPVCSASFRRIDLHRQHLETHPEYLLHRCEKCSACFSLRSELRQHLRAHSKSERYKCTVCSASFSGPGKLRTHLGTHSKSELYQCTKCSVSFSGPGKLRKHLATHWNYLHNCEKCSASFNLPSELALHLKRTHPRSEVYRCTVCSASFRRTGEYRKHLGTHSKLKLYECTMCSASFARPGKYREHLGTHSELQKGSPTGPV